MTIPKEAINKAIEGGWLNFELRKRLQKYNIDAGTFREAKAHDELKRDYTETMAALDPSFWQALGKALGWDMDERSIWTSRTGGKMGHLDGQMYRYNSPQWHAHHFYDLTLMGRDTDAYWKELLAHAA